MSEDIKIKTSIIKFLYDSLLPIHYKLDSILKFFFKDQIILADTDKALLLEFCSHSNTLKILFENYLEIAGDQKTLTIPHDEYLLLISMSKSVELASRTIFGNISMLEN